MAYPNLCRLSLRLLFKRNKCVLFKQQEFSYSKVRAISQSADIHNFKPQLKPSLTRSKVAEETDSLDTYDEKSQYQVLSNIILNKQSFSDVEFKEIREQLISEGRDLTDGNFDAIFIGVCRSVKAFSVGKAYFMFRYSEGKCNISTIGRYMRLCHDFACECTENDKSFIIFLYEELRKKYPILDYITSTNAACGLSITKNWKEGLRLMEMCKITSPPPGNMYCALIESAFKNKEFTIAFDLLNEMSQFNKPLTEGVLVSWMEARGFTRKGFNEILLFLEKHDIHPKEDLAKLLFEFHGKVNKQSKNFALTTIHQSGKCFNCNHHLKPLGITGEEFNELRDAFLNPVLIGKDIFLKTKPEEFKSFLSFLDNAGRVDVVLDGLNIAFSAADHRKFNKASAAKMVSDVVRHFVQNSKKTIVLGRKHMESWPKESMNYIKRNSNMFLAENITADDPLLLYAAMKSGLGTSFVSRDLMRGHKFLLKNPHLKSIFTRWQQKHQFYLKYVTPNGKVVLVAPLPYLQRVQESEPNIWHIPISSALEGVPGHLVATNTKWLCLV